MQFKFLTPESMFPDDVQACSQCGFAPPCQEAPIGDKVVIQSLHVNAMIGGLTKALRDPENEYRAHVACSLGIIGEQSQNIISTLVHGLGDIDEAVSGVSADGLRKIGELAVPALVEALDHEGQEKEQGQSECHWCAE